MQYVFLVHMSLSTHYGASLGYEWRNGLQIWKVAADTLNKQFRTADKGWSPRLGVWKVANNSP
jgi:hypothetical protein